MAKKKFGAQWVNALTTDKAQEDWYDAKTPGLCLRVSGRTGRKTWLVRYRASGKHRRMKIGQFVLRKKDADPDAGLLTLAQARKEALRVTAAADTGEDPARERQNGRGEGGGDTTFKALVDKVLRKKARDTRESTQQERRRIADTDLIPKWGGLEAADIARGDVITLVDAVEDRAGAPIANRTLSLIHLIFNEGLRLEFPGLEYNPAHMVEPKDEGRRRRYLDRDEIGAVWRSIGHENPLMGGVFKLALLTAARIGSVCSMKWADIGDDDVWTIPAEDFKGDRLHCVPLSAESLAVINGLRGISGGGDYVFPGRNPGEPVQSHNSALQRIRRRTEIPHWVAHDFRRTFRTHATRKAEKDPKYPKDPTGLGVDSRVADAVLGHKEASLGFDRYQAEPERYLLSEKREALALWGAFVAAAVKGHGRA